MKTGVICLNGLVCLSICISLQSAQPARAPAKTKDSHYDQKTLRGPHHRVWEFTHFETNVVGQVASSERRFVQLEPGLHYWEDDRWKPSQEIIEKDGQGAVARYGQHRVRFAPNLKTPGAIELTTPDGLLLRSHILGLSYFDAASGKSVLLAEVAASVGVIIPPNQVVYPDAFTDDISADIQFTWSKSGFEQDIIVREALPGPEEYGLDPETTRLEVLTEYLNSPDPKKERRVISGEADPARRQAMAEPDFIDENLDFGAMKMVPGKAFTLGEAPGDGEAIEVGKQWQKLEGRDFLIEAVEYRSAKEKLKALPQRKAPAANAPPTKKQAAVERKLPSIQVAGTRAGEEIQVVGVELDRPGFVLDYVLVTGVTDMTFSSGTTYYVSSSVNLFGTSTIQAGTVVKYEPNCSLFFNGPVVCNTSAGSLGVFTSKHDNSYGEVLPGSTGNPAGQYSAWALFFNDIGSSRDISYLRVRYAAPGILFFGQNYTGVWHTFRDSRLEECPIGVTIHNTAANLSNLTICNVGTLYSGEITYSVNVGTVTTDCGGGPPPPPSDDHGNSIASATPLSLNSSVSGNIETGGDHDYFRIDVTSSGTLTTYTTGNTDTYGYLLDSGGNTLAYNDDTQGYNFRIVQSVSAGTYYVKVRHYSPSGTGPYALYTEFSSGGGGDDHGNSITAATAVSVNSTTAGTINYNGDEDFFRMDMSISGTLTAYTTGSTDTYGYLLDASGNTLAYNDDNPYPNFRFSYSVSPGTYYVRVRHFSYNGLGSYNFVLEGPADSDGDGMPDWWEIQYFGNLSQTASGDYDGDGLTNLQEYQGGTDPTAAPACVPAPSGLVSWWRAEGSAFDVNGLNSGAPQSGASYGTGKVGQAFSLDGVDDVISMPNSASLNFNSNSPITLETWVYRTGSGSIMHVVGKRYYCGDINYQLAFDPSGGLQFNSFNGGVYSGVQLAMFQWTHLAGTYESGTFRLYINGALAGTGSGSLGSPNSASFLIGGAGTCGYTFAGLIDEVSLYNRALSAGEIQGIYAAGALGKCLPDTDGDGLPDDWELQYFGGLSQNGSSDFEGDGVNNLAEYQSGTNPTIFNAIVKIARPRNGSNIP